MVVKMHMQKLVLLILAVAQLSACVDADKHWANWDGSMAGSDLLGSSGDTIPGLISLSILPKDTVITQELNKSTQVPFKVTGHFTTGQRDLTSVASFTLRDSTLGYFEGASLKTTRNQGGRSSVEANVGSIGASTKVTVKIKLTGLGAGVPTDAADRFKAPCTGGGTIKLAYPETGTMVPPNLAEFTVMWVDAVSDLWQLTLSSETSELVIYTDKTKHLVSAQYWKILATSNLAESISISVRGVNKASPTTCATSSKEPVVVGPAEIKGGIYYWITRPNNAIMRYDFGQAAKKPEAFVSQEKTGYCVGCHAISPDGTRLAFVDSQGTGRIMDVEKATMLPTTGTKTVSFQTFTPDNKYLISSDAGKMFVRDGTTGALVVSLDLGGSLATHPELSPSGDTLLYTQPSHLGPGSNYLGGSISTVKLAGISVSLPTRIVKGSDTQNNYYPSFSPDGKWIIFNRSSSGSYSIDQAELWVVKASGGTPVQLKRANQGKDLRNSWARWSPFTHLYKGKPLFWFSFSSIRDYGTELENSKKGKDAKIPQIWMTAFNPALAEAGKDPSYPAFWLPYQELLSKNHIAQWTKKVPKVQ